jgi:TatD DNase family protein
MSPRPRQVDFHCHLDLYSDLAMAIAECDAAEVATLAVTTTPKAFRQNVKLARHSKFVRVGLGLHPHLAAERKSELPLFEALLSETRYVGEIGLDSGPRFYRSMPVQTEVFRRILEMCAAQGGKILSVHSVRTASKVLDIIEELLPRDRGRVVMHWFSGTKAEAKRAAELGCYFSINQVMLQKPKGRELVQSLPTERLLTETDGPFVEEDKQPVGPGNVQKVVHGLSDTLGVSLGQARNLVVQNLINLIS